MGESADTEDAAPSSDTDERLRAIEAHLRSISGWITWFGYLSVVVILVVVIIWIVGLTR